MASETPTIKKVKQSVGSPWRLKELDASSFQDSRHIKVVSLSALRIDHPYPQGDIPGTHFC